MENKDNIDDKNAFKKISHLTKKKRANKIFTINNSENKTIKKNNRINKNKTKIKISIFLKKICLIFLIFQLFHQTNLNDLKIANITLKVKGPGIRKILGYTDSDNTLNPSCYPNEIYINGEKKVPVTHSYDFNQTNNTVKLFWDHTIAKTTYLFYGCSDITEIDLSHFDSSEVTDMGWMFRNCTSLTSINFTNFDTSKTTRLNRMFQNCSSLSSIDVSNFKTSRVVWFHIMFEGCVSLTSLDLSNFDTSNIEKMKEMFKNCDKLEFINMSNFNEQNMIYPTDPAAQIEYHEIFEGVSDNIIVCIDKDLNRNIIIPQLKNKKCYIIYCSDDWKTKQQKAIETVNGCNCEFNSCLACPTNDINKTMCSQCNENYYPIEDDPTNDLEYRNCYRDPIGYYLDTNKSIYKKCYDSCHSCEAKGDKVNHNCLICDSDYSYAIDNNNYLNCFENCNYYHYFDEDNNYHCTNVESCPNEYPLLIPEQNECIKFTIETSAFIEQS